MYDNIKLDTGRTRPTRPISWVQSARRAFERWPDDVKKSCWNALTVAAEGGKADTAKPMTGLGPGVLEIAIKHRKNAFRVVYALRIGEVIWVVHAFQKKSTQGIKTPRREIELIEARIKALEGQPE